MAGSIALLWSIKGAPGVRFPPTSDLWLFGVFGQNLTDATALKLNPPLWTLAVEVSYYLVLPALGWLALRLRGAGRTGQLAVPVAMILTAARLQPCDRRIVGAVPVQAAAGHGALLRGGHDRRRAR